MSQMNGVDGFLMKVDALYKVEAGHQWYMQVSKVMFVKLFIYSTSFYKGLIYNWC